MRKRLPANVYSFSVSADVFQDGEVYTWTLRQAYSDNTFKSDAAYDAFKVIKK
jgi:hypothetical protein